MVGLVGYGVVKATAKEEPKKKTGPDIPELPEDMPPGFQPGAGDTGIFGGGVVQRVPMPDFSVPLPETAQDHEALDQKICEGYWSFDVFQGRDPSDAAIAALQIIAPEVEWPSVPGDHVSLRQLEQIVRYRADQIAYSGNAPTHENFADFCGPKPEKASPQDLGGVQWIPPGD